MVNIRRLTQHAQKAKGMIDQQGGTDALKEKAAKMRGVASGEGSVKEKAKAAAAVASEKPNPAAATSGDDLSQAGQAPTPAAADPSPAPQAPAKAQGDPSPVDDTADDAPKAR